MAETGLAVGALTLVGHFDSIHWAPDGRIRFHYTILDFAAPYPDGEPGPGSVVAELRWAAERDLGAFGLRPVATAMIARPRALLGQINLALAGWRG